MGSLRVLLWFCCVFAMPNVWAVNLEEEQLIKNYMSAACINVEDESITPGSAKEKNLVSNLRFSKRAGVFNALQTEKCPNGKTIHDIAKERKLNLVADLMTGRTPGISNVQQAKEQDQSMPKQKICLNGKQKQAIKHSIRLVVPKPPKGVPRSMAKDCKDKMMYVTEYFLENFYNHLTSDKLGRLSLFELKSSNQPNLDAHFAELAKQSSRAKDWCPISENGIDNREVIGLYASNLNLLRYVENNAEVLYLIFGNVPEELKGLKIDLDLDEMRKADVLYLPKKTLKSFDLDTEDSEEEPYSISWMLQQSDEIWSAYFTKYTTFKRANTKDPNYVNYEASLNFDLACKFLRKKTDLISR